MRLNPMNRVITNEAEPDESGYYEQEFCMRKFLVFVLIAAMVALHQDFWLWKDNSLVFGFLPIGLAYHAGYSLLAAVVMWFLVKLAWPKHLEHVEKDRKHD